MITKACHWPIFLIFLCCSCDSDLKESARQPHANTANTANDVDRLFQLADASITNIKFSNDLKENERVNILMYEYFYNGGGVALGDINNDGLVDIYFTGNQVKNKLYLNLGGLKFKDITASAGVEGGNLWSTGVTMADVNGDGWLDIYVCNSGKLRPENRKNELFINQGNLTFKEEGELYGIADPGYSTQGLFVDIDNDNDLDLFLLNHAITLFLGKDAMQLKQQIDPYAGDKLFQNEKGKFTEISQKAGIHQNPLGYGLGVTAGDLNKDGWIDIYVTNDYVEPDYLYINNGDGSFTDKIKSATNHISNFGMGVDIADIDNDTWPDIFVADMVAEDNYRQKTNMRSMNPQEFYQAVKFGFHHQYMFNTLQLNNQNSTFSEIGQMAGISNTDWSWATLLGDFDNDGFNDLFITNGFRKEFANKDYVSYKEKVLKAAADQGKNEQLAALRDLLAKLPENKIGNYLFKNNGNYTFSNMSKAWGIDLPAYSNGAAIADLDNDGDLDIVVNNIDELAFIFENKAAAIEKNHYFKVAFDGPAGNSSAIGSKVYVYADSKQQYKEQITTRGYQSGISNVLHFGLGKTPFIDSIKVVWPDGKISITQKVNADTILTFKYDNAKINPVVKNALEKKLFQDITQAANINFRHQENFYDDFKKEILLPYKMSQFGPALAVADVDNDGLEDFFVGGASGFGGNLYRQKPDGTFEVSDNYLIFEHDYLSEDVGAAFFDADGDQDLDLYVASGGNEFTQNSQLYEDRLYINNGNGLFSKSNDQLPKIRESTAAVKPFDYDKDGDIDLFVGGRLTPQRYPLPASSRILNNDRGRFIDVTDEIATEFNTLGLVTDAVWTQLDQDKTQLVVVGEWMPITIFEFQNGKFLNQTKNYNLSGLTGWWYHILSDDYDNDGDQDLIVGNLGLNSKFKASPAEPFEVYYGDFDDNGIGDIILGYFNQGELYPLRGRQCSSQQMPVLEEQFSNYHEFGEATLLEVYGNDFLTNSLNYKASYFNSMMLVNDGDGMLTTKSLPMLAQISNINTSLCRDFNGDGLKDILLAGNMYPVEVETIRNDALHGLLLEGNVSGFKVVRNKTSGFMAAGDVKHIAEIGLVDGGVGVLVARNNGLLSLFRATGFNSNKIVP